MQLRILVCLRMICGTTLQESVKIAPPCRTLVLLFNYCAVECDRLLCDVRTSPITTQLNLLVITHTSQYKLHKLTGGFLLASFFLCLTKELTELNAKPSWNFP
jgi:hypothetical protein